MLINSLKGDSRTHELIKADLTRSLKELTTGKDAGLSFSEVFGRKRLKRH